ALPGRRSRIECSRLALALPFEVDPQRSELLLDGARSALAFFEVVSLCRRELPFGRRFHRTRLGLGETCSQLLHALLGPCRLGVEVGSAPLEVALAFLDGLRALEGGALAGNERFAACARIPLALLAALEPALELRQLALSVCDRFRPLAQDLLQLLELVAPVPLLGLALRGELAGEPKQRLAVEIDAGVV